MKYVIVLSDGMAGRPLDELGGKTTLEAANTPVIDRLAEKAEIGMAAMVPEGMAPGSDTANLSVMGYDPKIYYTGRSPLEALSIGVDMESTDVSFRCNIVTLSENEGNYEDRIVIDHSSGEISTEEAAVLVEALKEVDGQMFICADHGNAEQLVDYNTGDPFTAHTTNPVPFILVNYDEAYTLREGGCLADIVPTMIEMMGMEQPKEMTGKSLLIRK